MGYIAHDAVVVTTSGARGALPDIDGFRQSLPAEFRHLAVGPVPSVTNDYYSYAWLPDGSKEGWADSDLGDEHRARFVALFDQFYEDGSSQDDVVEVRFGGDHAGECGATVKWRSGSSSGQGVAP